MKIPLLSFPQGRGGGDFCVRRAPFDYIVMTDGKLTHLEIFPDSLLAKILLKLEIKYGM